MATLTVSVVIVSYYNDDVLFDNVSALRAQAGDSLTIDVIIVDNGNSSATKSQLQTLAADGAIQLIPANGNIGFSAGCNLGVAQARSENILLLNPDCIPQPSAIHTLLATHQQSQQTNAPHTLLSGWLTNPDGSEQRGLRRKTLTPWSLLAEMLPVLNRLAPLKYLRLNQTDAPVNHDIIAVQACSGACLLMQKSVYKDLHGMDTGYFLHVEDLDFCRRWVDAGGNITIHRQAIFVHQQGSSKASGKKIARHKRDGFKRYFATHHPLFWHSPLGWGLAAAIYCHYWAS